MNTKTLKSLSQCMAMLLMMALLSGVTFPALAAPDDAISASADSKGTDKSLAVFTQLDLYPNIETIGVVVSGASLPTTAQLMYRQASETAWHTGHPLMRIDDGRLIGSLFGLSPSTSYSVKVFDGTTEIGGSTTTQPNELQFTPSVVLHVDINAASGGDGSAGAPFQTIQQGINRAGPGTQVLVADGIYHEAITFPASGSAGNWIQVRAQGNGAILDGSQHLSGNIWTPVEGRRNVWFTKIGASIRYLARDQKRFYAYDTIADLYEGRGHNRVPMSEGWFVEPYTWKLYVRSVDNPANHTWQVPRLNRAFNVDGRDWLWIEGFEMRFYGGSEHGCGVCTKNASHVVIRRNRIHNLQLGIFTNWDGGEDRGNDTRIEFNEIYDPPVNEWPWNAVKSTSMEGTAIVVRGHIGSIVRGNDIHNFFNGIYTGSSAAAALENAGVAFDADIYNNYIHHISDDALEPEGACVNHRFRNNRIDVSYVGISLAPITKGPTWMLRSLISNYTGRSIKWDGNSDGIVLIYHNTSWTTASSTSGMDFISPAHNAIMRNNIFQSTGFAFAEVPTGSTGNDWNNDNWYTTLGSSGPHFKWENVLYNNIAALCAASGLECKGYEDPPGLANPGGGDFTLLSSSPNIDRGVVIPGINDYYAGSAPDVGLYESALDSPPTVSAVIRADANPTNAASVNFTVTFSEPVIGVDTTAPFNDFALAVSPGIAGAAITSVTPVSGTTYVVSVNTGSGSGTIRLDLLDDDSIVDSAGNRLGGAGAGNGNFSGGDSYSVDKNLLAATGILRTDPTPTAADSVYFAVTFSKEVTGVDASDFTLTTSGGISGAVVASVSGSGAVHTVAVNTGIGDGTLRLDLIDNDSIMDANTNPLGGAGAGNGNFTTGEAYVINKTVPVVMSILRADPDPTSAETVRFAVTFSEVVAGVDSADFTVTAIGASGASVRDVTGLGNIYIVTVGTGAGNGSLRLDLVDNDSILDLAGSPLGGFGPGNANYVTGETYTISKVIPPPVATVTETFRSNGTNDGWVLESSEDSNRGGFKDASATTFLLGDDARDRQYRAILHFPTATLPDNAVITMVILSIKKQGQSGTDPFTTHGNILIDIRSGAFGAFGLNALQLDDFQGAASRAEAGLIPNNPVGAWYWSTLDSTAFPYINPRGVTQLRLRFQRDDNDDMGNDYVRFFSGNLSSQADRPQLVVKYYVP